jgi:hypothetical protein
MSQSNESIPSQPSPCAEWGLEKLAEFVREAGVQAGVLEADALKIGSKILRLHYERGRALVLVRDEVLGNKREAWARFRKENGFVGTTYNDDIRLYESAYSWGEIAGMGLTEARVYLGVTKPKVRTPKEAEAAPLPHPPSADAPETTATSRPQAPLAIAQAMPPAGGSPETEEDEPATPPVTPPTVVSGPKAPADNPSSPEETLFRIVRRLEELEREAQGHIAEAAFPLIDRAVEVLGRLRGAATQRATAA